MRLKDLSMLVRRPQPEWDAFGFALATADNSVIVRTRHYLPAEGGRPSATVLLALQSLAQLVALALLFTSTSNIWFRESTAYRRAG